MNNYNDFMYQGFTSLQQPLQTTQQQALQTQSYNTTLNSMSSLNQNNLNLYNSYEGYMRGNIFRDLYDSYKEYQPQRLVGTTKQQQKLLELSDAMFYAHDLNLYLDVYPNDNQALRLFNKYRVRANKLLEEYEKTYGPINLASNSLNQSPWMWDEKTFPWEEDKNV